jgi:hypothetical protein
VHFVQDGHHRVSVARSHGDATIEAHIRDVQTTLFATAELMRGGLWRDRAAVLDAGRASCTTALRHSGASFPHGPHVGTRRPMRTSTAQ